MSRREHLGNIAKAVIDANLYMVLGTTREVGRTWVTPVYFASANYTDFYWVSRPESEHSRNIAQRAEVSIVIFNSHTAIGTAGDPVNEGDISENQALYMSAVAGEVSGTEVAGGIDIFSQASVAQGGGEWTTEKVQPPAALRLYRARASEQSILCPVSYPEPCSIHGRTDDHRVDVDLR